MYIKGMCLHAIAFLHASMINLPDSFKAGAITIWSCRILHQNWFSTNLTISEACFCMRMPVYEPLVSVLPSENQIHKPVFLYLFLLNLSLSKSNNLDLKTVQLSTYRVVFLSSLSTQLLNIQVPEIDLFISLIPLRSNFCKSHSKLFKLQGFNQSLQAPPLINRLDMICYW